MDYKTTILLAQINTNETIFPELDSLHFGAVDSKTLVFDCTAFVEEQGLTEFDHKTFMRTNKRYIEYVTLTTKRKSSEMFYQNKDGHILMCIELVFIFLLFVSPTMFSYLNSLLYEAETQGVAHTASYVYQLAQSHLDENAIQELTKEIENDNNENE